MEPLEKIQPISSVVNQPHQFSYENGIYFVRLHWENQSSAIWRCWVILQSVER